MNVLTVNTGSSSVRLAAFAVQDGRQTLLASDRKDRNEGSPAEVLRGFIDAHGLDSIAAIAHRVVHGGARLISSRLIDAAVEAEIDRLSVLAPLHNPVALAWIRGCREHFGARVPQVGVFDTAFFATLPAEAATYALPAALSRRHGIRRYGFHGTAHEAMWRRWRQLRPDLAGGGRVISLQLGAGCSITAVDQGEPKDTSMGFSPLEGLVMATRSGDLDPGLVTFLQTAEGLSAGDCARLLNEQSGLLGLSGVSDDIRAVLERDDPPARLAVDVYCYRARKYIGAYLAVLRGADGILFGGGVGEHVAAVRERILAPMDWCGLALDRAANRSTIGREGRISAPHSRIDVWVVPTDEASLLADAAVEVLRAAGQG